MGIKKTNKDKDKSGSLSALAATAFEKINFHIVILISVLFLILNTTIFTDNVLAHIPNAVSGNQETLYGVMIKTAIFAIGAILLFLLF